MTLDLEKAIEDAIVKRFFEPSWAQSVQPTYGPDGAMRQEVVNYQVPAPMTLVAEAIYNTAHEKILARVMERLDFDVIAEQWMTKIVEDVVKKLQEANPNGWMAKPGPSEREKMLDKVYNEVAKEFGRQCVEHLRQTGGLMAVLDA